MCVCVCVCVVYANINAVHRAWCILCLDAGRIDFMLTYIALVCYVFQGMRGQCKFLHKDDKRSVSKLIGMSIGSLSFLYSTHTPTHKAAKFFIDPIEDGIEPLNWLL